MDLNTIATQAILVTDGYSIKDLEKYYDFKRNSDIKKGEVSEEYYNKWIETGDKKFLDEIAKYNKEDCISTREFHNWLIQRRDKNLSWFVPKIEELDLRPREIAIKNSGDKLKNSNLKNKNLKQIMTDILGFYYRSNKPKWRRYFDRKYKTHEEISDDTECIGNMRQIGKEEVVKKSYVFTYKYDEQDFKLKKGDTAHLANNELLSQPKRAGTIVSIDHHEREIKISRAINQDFYQKLFQLDQEIQQE